jgi:hypothetical protein
MKKNKNKEQSFSSVFFFKQSKKQREEKHGKFVSGHVARFHVLHVGVLLYTCDIVAYICTLEHDDDILCLCLGFDSVRWCDVINCFDLIMSCVLTWLYRIPPIMQWTCKYFGVFFFWHKVNKLFWGWPFLPSHKS